MGCGASAGPPRVEDDDDDGEEDGDDAGDGEKRGLVALGDEDATDSSEDEPMPLPDVDVVDEYEEVQECEAVDLEHVPDYWVNKQIGDESSSFDDLFYVSAEHHGAFNEMLKATYLPRVTQDRPCPTGEHERVKGGCKCVRPDGDPGLPVSYHVRKVLRVEDSGMWGRYVKKRESIRTARGDEKFRPFHPRISSDEVAAKYPELFAPLETKLNEVYLFHGTRVRYALSIAQDDFNIDLAGTGAGTMYGAGAYLAESSTKADEYAKDEKNGYYEGVFAMLICRVCMGKLYYTRKKAPEAADKIKDGSHDSTCGDRAHPPINTFRELVVYDADQLYPEYIVLYQRAHKADNPEEVIEFCSQPYHMELPLYWSNNAKDPNLSSDEEGGSFDAQYLVRPATKTLLQQLVDESTGGKWHIQQARRVEIANVWRRYVDCKLAMRERIGDGESFDPQLEESELPATMLADIVAARESAERSFSSEDFEKPLNDHFLWCAGSKEAAEWLSRGVECGKQLGLPLADIRFHTKLETSLGSVEESDDTNRYVLLCRVACGDFLIDSDSEEVALENSKDSILLSNEDGETKSVRVLREEQVYVEYILELGLAEASEDLDGASE